jgi:hypothetical protein
METFQVGNKFYLIKQTHDESREVYLERSNYIIKRLRDRKSDLEENDYIEAINLSYIWRNIKFYGMTYPSLIIKNL